ncbi:hypothetical protein [Blastococcus sp. URHD0036]|uniref:hypothetical protein n=1 Tax=Blastococcus sp. URHD0036 TaxID=1380356 RepID=UPI000495C8CC|nr:hypothetical protein [Blastococcus sp. URHD0036]
MTLTGTPSDDDEAILATGRSGVATAFVSLGARHPDGADADYLAWHSLDHRPEQQRLPALRTSLRLVSTPECRAARAPAAGALDAVDHVMTYWFTDESGLDGFRRLSAALRGAGRTPFVVPPVERGVYGIRERRADPAILAGADVLPWWPAVGVYLLVERSAAEVAPLVEVPGVAGVWSAVAGPVGADSTAPAGQQLTWCFLDDDPVAAAARLRPVVEERSRAAGHPALLAAPFQVVVPHAWDRYLP